MVVQHGDSPRSNYWMSLKIRESQIGCERKPWWKLLKPLTGSFGRIPLNCHVTGEVGGKVAYWIFRHVSKDKNVNGRSELCKDMLLGFAIYPLRKWRKKSPDFSWKEMNHLPIFFRFRGSSFRLGSCAERISTWGPRPNMKNSHIISTMSPTMWLFPKIRGTPKWMVYNGKPN